MQVAQPFGPCHQPCGLVTCGRPNPNRKAPGDGQCLGKAGQVPARAYRQQHQKPLELHPETQGWELRWLPKGFPVVFEGTHAITPNGRASAAPPQGAYASLALGQETPSSETLLCFSLTHTSGLLLRLLRRGSEVESC